jgi:hypothetical protein
MPSIIIGNLVENDVYSIQGYFLIIPVLKSTNLRIGAIDKQEKLFKYSE